MLAALREAVLDEVRHTPVRTFDEALLYGAATDYVKARERQPDVLRRHGTRVIDVEPRHLPERLVTRYWEIKRARAIQALTLRRST